MSMKAAIALPAAAMLLSSPADRCDQLCASCTYVCADQLLRPSQIHTLQQSCNHCVPQVSHPGYSPC